MRKYIAETYSMSNPNTQFMEIEAESKGQAKRIAIQKCDSETFLRCVYLDTPEDQAWRKGK